MGVVIEKCVKYPGGPTRMTVTDMAYCITSRGTPGVFYTFFYRALITPIAPALKNYYTGTLYLGL
jgi:hypothetical protein